MSFISRQPNGLLCRHSSVVDCVTDYNMTDEEYIEICAENARKEARERIANHFQPFDYVKDYFVPNNMTRKEFNRIMKEMHDTTPGKKHTTT